MTPLVEQAQSRARMPVMFVGHGSPLNGLMDNRWSRGYSALSELMPRPKAILGISAHWYTQGIYLTGNDYPPTIYDFGGFPPELYSLEYPCHGNLQLAQRICDILAKDRATISHDWGLDHGIWTILRWMYPQADIPVIQLSIDRTLDLQKHYELGQSLAALRNEGILILASGNIVHNLRDAIQQMNLDTTNTPDWARRFDESTRHAIMRRDIPILLSLPDNPYGRVAHPTPEHWLPLVYALGASNKHDQASFPMEGFDLGSISMRSIIFTSN